MLICSILAGAVFGCGSNEVAWFDVENELARPVAHRGPDLLPSNDVDYGLPASVVQIRAGQVQCSTYAVTELPTVPNPGKNLIVADVDGDSHLDLLISGNAVYAELFYGDGRGFGPPQRIPYGSGGTLAAHAHDADADGRVDLIFVVNVGNWGHGTVLVHNDGNRSFTVGAIDEWNDSFGWIHSVGDLTGDGRPEFVGVNINPNCTQAVTPPNAMTSMVNLGNGRFAQGTTYATGNEPADVVGADLDGDGDRDLGVTETNAGFSVWLNDGRGAFTFAARYAVGAAESVTAGDLDGDGDNDLVVVNWGYAWSGWKIVLLENQGNGAFQIAGTSMEVYEAGLPLIVDFDGDGTKEILVSSYRQGEVAVLRKSVGGVSTGLSIVMRIRSGGSALHLFAGDFDENGVDDVVVTDSAWSQAVVNIIRGGRVPCGTVQ